VIELADIFRRYGEDYLTRFGDAVLPSHRRAIRDIIDCRTPALGGQVYTCDHCGHPHYVYHSCRNRSCPKCHATDTAHWLAQRRAELLAVPYFHVVFTVPQELRPVARRHQKVIYGLMMKAAAASLIQLAANPRYVGGLIGVTAVLHTWTRTLTYHPHVHCLVPGGGVSPEGSWLAARPNFLVPVKALSKIFRAKLRDRLAETLPDEKPPASLWKRDWVVYCKPVIQTPAQLLDYLGRYVHRIAITNRRIISADKGQVSFRYQPTDQTAWRTLTLPAQEFIRRFLQHVLPAGTHKVRYYGLASPARRPLLRRVQVALLADRPVAPPPLPSSSPPNESNISDACPSLLEPVRPWPSWAGQTCPRCQLGKLVPTGRLPRLGRPPP
jgi:Putative transposase/Transposase zinc-binding domain